MPSAPISIPVEPVPRCRCDGAREHLRNRHRQKRQRRSGQGGHSPIASTNHPHHHAHAPAPPDRHPEPAPPSSALALRQGRPRLSPNAPTNQPPINPPSPSHHDSSETLEQPQKLCPTPAPDHAQQRNQILQKVPRHLRKLPDHHRPRIRSPCRCRQFHTGEPVQSVITHHREQQSGAGHNGLLPAKLQGSETAR